MNDATQLKKDKLKAAVQAFHERNPDASRMYGVKAKRKRTLLLGTTTCAVCDSTFQVINTKIHEKSQKHQLALAAELRSL
jgi:hypothetical protein